MALPTSFDIQAHNEEVREVWASYRAGKPIRVPVTVGCYERCTLDDPLVNPRRIQYEDAFRDPQLMLERELEHASWLSFQPWQDRELGLPEEGWEASPNFQNIYEAAWFGCPVVFVEGQVPDSEPILAEEDSKRKLFDKGLPDPFEGPFASQVWKAYDHYLQKKEEGWTWEGLPLRKVYPPMAGTDGPVTVACNLRGATGFLEDLVFDPDFAEELMAFIVEATIHRIRAINDKVGHPQRWSNFWFADDSIQLISTSMYAEQVLPHHRKLVEAFSDGSPGGIHLCGNATRHFPLLKRELNIHAFETGFPVDHGALRRELGPEVEIIGGPSVPFLLQAAPEEVEAEVRRICESGVMEGGRFILREGNNLAPNTPAENLMAMRRAGMKHGRFPAW